LGDPGVEEGEGFFAGDMELASAIVHSIVECWVDGLEFLGEDDEVSLPALFGPTFVAGGVLLDLINGLRTSGLG